ncbi:uncharacterized protein LOC120996234 isoform X2 [Bufo bufo]|uniref:uncharacterized protein LOC120996234 isoform X2 n=1 Tax=Bufo bufo TaxID=8384 RepID=UPI001ABED45F|nr:uncharacterized protein LOC120996234 isoform X2 [Bufo bufo]
MFTHEPGQQPSALVIWRTEPATSPLPAAAQTRLCNRNWEGIQRNRETKVKSWEKRLRLHPDSSAMSPPDTCAFCQAAEEDEVTGEMQRTPDGTVVAHYNCMLYSPQVISINSQEDIQGFNFDIGSVQSEIKRGQELRCNLCKKRGATVGCDVKSCRRTYHYPCVLKAKGSSSPKKFVVHCFYHTRERKNANDSKDIHGKAKKCIQRYNKKRWQKMVGKVRKNNIKKQHDDSAAMQNVHPEEQSEDNFILAIHSTVEIEDSEEALPSSSGQHMSSGTALEESGTASEESGTASEESGTASEESDSILNPKVNKVFSLSGFPKRKKYRSKRKRNEKLEEILQTMASEEKAALSQMYSELGGSQQSVTIEMTANQDHRNDNLAVEDSLDSDVTDNSSCSGNIDIDKTPERLLANPSRRSTEENHFIGEDPDRLQDEETPDRMSAHFSKRRKTTNDIWSSGSNREDRSCRSTLDVPSCSANFTQSVAPPLGMSDGIKLPTQQIHSTNRKEKLLSEGCTDAKKSTRPDTSEGCSSHVLNVEPARDLGVQESSETQPSEDLSVTEPESPSCSPFILERDGNKVDVSTSVSDAALEKMENNSKTLWSAPNGQNRGTVSNILSPQQRNSLPSKLEILSQHLRSHILKIQSTIETSKRKTAENAEHSKADTQNQLHAAPQLQSNIESTILSPGTSERQATSEGSPSPNRKDQPADNYLREPLENQKSSGIPNEKINLVCQERSESITSRRNLFPELLPNMNLQQTEGNLNENLEIPEEQVESNLEETALVEEPVTPGSVSSECVEEHQSGPSRMVTPYRRRLRRSLHRSKSRRGFQREDLDDLDGFGSAVAGQCRRMPTDRQTKYMSYVLASADLFCTHPILPELDILITNLRTVLERSQPSTPCSGCGSSGY